MRAVVQRAAWARVTVDGEIVGSLDGPGLVVLLGVTNGDGEKEALAMASKLWMLRIMRDAEGRMNRSVADIGGGLLVISQFTLYGDASKGRRPSFVAAAPGEGATHEDHVRYREQAAQRQAEDADKAAIGIVGGIHHGRDRERW